MSRPNPENRYRALAGSSHLDSNVGVGLDIAIVALVFVFLGWLIDRWLGTTPWFMVALSVLGLVGQGVRMYYVYEEKMRELDAERLAARHGGSKVAPHAATASAATADVAQPGEPQPTTVTAEATDLGSRRSRRGRMHKGATA